MCKTIENCQTKHYAGIDLFKLVAAILVVFLHATETTAWLPCELKYVFTRLAVPFFFIASGFFFFKGLNNADNTKNYFIHYEKKILTLFVVWALVLYLPFVIFSYVHNNPNAGVLKITLLLIRRVFVIGPGPYWYLVALMWSTAFLYYCYRKSRLLLKAAIGCGLLLEICYTCFEGVLSNLSVFCIFFKLVRFIYSWEFNFFMFGIPFTGIGFLIAEENLNWRKATSVFLLVGSTAMRFVEYNLPRFFPSDFWDTNCISLAFIIQSVAFFMLAKAVEVDLDYKTSLTIRKFSSCIYFAHAILLYNIINPILDHCTDLPTYSEIMILPKVLVILFLCWILFFVIKKTDNPHLNILING